MRCGGEKNANSEWRIANGQLGYSLFATRYSLLVPDCTDETDQAAISGRSRRQPPAPRSAQGGPRQARARGDHRRSIAGGGESRDREGHQQAGGGRARARDRRRVPPLLVAFRFLQGARWRGALLHRAGHRLRRGCDQGGERAGRRQDRFLEPSTHRAFSLRQGSHQGRGEDDDTGAQTMSGRPTARPFALSTTRAAAICSSTTPPGR